jgi:hypothetical protein
MICPNCGRLVAEHGVSCWCWSPISGQMNSSPSAPGGGLAEHWTAVAARKNRDAAIRDEVLGDLKAWCIQTKCNGCPYGGALFNKIDELRQQGKEGEL